MSKNQNLPAIIYKARLNMLLNESWAFQLSLKETLNRLHSLGYEEYTIFDIKRKFHELDKQYRDFFLNTTKE